VTDIYKEFIIFALI